jgi:hypothetical protein
VAALFLPAFASSVRFSISRRSATDQFDFSALHALSAGFAVAHLVHASVLGWRALLARKRCNAD